MTHCVVQSGSVVFKNASVRQGTEACYWEVAELVGGWDGACGTWVGCCWGVSLTGLRRHVGSIHCCFNCVQVCLLLELTNVLLVAYSLVAKPIRDLRIKWTSDIWMWLLFCIHLATSARIKNISYCTALICISEQQEKKGQSFTWDCKVCVEKDLETGTDPKFRNQNNLSFLKTSCSVHFFNG